MKIYVAILQENDYDAEPCNIGVYSSYEKAENALLQEICEIDKPILSLEIYREQEEEPNYNYFIEEYELDV